MGQNRCCRCLLDDKIPESVFPGGKLIYYAFCQICSSTESQLIFFEQFSHTSARQGLSFSILLLTICLAIFRSLRVAPCLRSVRLDDWLGVGIGASSAHCKTLALKILKNTKWSWWTVSQLFKAINILWPRCWKNEVNKWEWRENKDARIISVIVIRLWHLMIIAEWKKWVISSSRPLHSLPFFWFSLIIVTSKPKKLWMDP